MADNLSELEIQNEANIEIMSNDMNNVNEINSEMIPKDNFKEVQVVDSKEMKSLLDNSNISGEEKRKEERLQENQILYDWVDVTESFNEAVSALKLGELSHDRMFGLFEAMSAIEMMDPKMDAGMMCNRGNKKVLNFNQAVAENKLKLDNLTSEELIGIIDSTLACMVTWLEGHSLAQTLFTNLYIHKPFMIESKVLKSFIIIVLKIIDVIREFVIKACVFEEEDFQPVVYGFKLAHDVTEARAISMIKEMEDEMQRKVKNTRLKQGEERDEKTELLHEEATAIFSRLRFCRLFYQSLIGFSRKEYNGLDDVKKYLFLCKDLIPAIIKTIPLGIVPEKNHDMLNKADYPTIMGFEPLVNQRLLPPTFPRYTKICDRNESYEYFDGLISRFQLGTEVLNCQNFHSALDFFVDYSKSSPCVLSRSVLQLIYLPQGNKVFGLHSINDIMKEAARSFICPPAFAPRSQLLELQQCKDYVDEFFNHCVMPLCSLIQLSGHNRARQRDKLAHVLEDLVTLQDGADKVDACLNNVSSKSDPPRQHLACFGTWILYHTLRVMINYMLSGFELELYSKHEYVYIYWYLHEFLYNWIISALSRANRFLIDQESLNEQQQPKNRNSKKNKKKKKMKSHSREIAFYQGQQNLCAGYYKAIVAFTLEGKIKGPNFPFDNEQVRYEHRFQPFSCIVTPPLVHYHQYQEMTNLYRYDHVPSVENLFASASKCFEQAKNLFDKISNPSQEIMTFSRIAKTNLVVINLVLGGHKRESMASPEFDFSLHSTFPVIKVI